MALLGWLVFYLLLVDGFGFVAIDCVWLLCDVAVVCGFACCFWVFVGCGGVLVCLCRLRLGCSRFACC